MRCLSSASLPRPEARWGRLPSWPRHLAGDNAVHRRISYQAQCTVCVRDGGCFADGQGRQGVRSVSVNCCLCPCPALIPLSSSSFWLQAAIAPFVIGGCVSVSLRAWAACMRYHVIPFPIGMALVFGRRRSSHPSEFVPACAVVI
jgi:hypothetical protein